MKRIALDIGHANGTGATGNGLKEHEVSEKIARLVVAMLREVEGLEVEVFDFPEQSNRADLNATISAVNAGSFDAVVSFHCDCANNIEAHGAHCCYKTLKGYALAIEIAERLCVFLPGRAEKCVKRTDLAILNQTRPPAVLVEMGFLSNPWNAHRMKDASVIIARSIAGGIRTWCQV